MIDLDEVSDLVRHVAARVHVPLFDTGLDHEEKSPGELVSRVDREAEMLLVEGLRDLTPGVAVLGEEAASADSSLLAALHDQRPAFAQSDWTAPQLTQVAGTARVSRR